MEIESPPLEFWMIAIAWVIASVGWLATVYFVLVNYGILFALLAFFFPPADLIFMFLVGTWPFFLIAFVLGLIGARLEEKSSS